MSNPQNASLLYFRPKAARKWSEHQYLLFPALAYHVTAPRMRNRTLNPLQKAVAMLVRTGLLEANEIGPKLDIHDDLAFLILRELKQGAYITQAGLSDLGRCALQNDSVLSYEWVSGFVFQDPWTGKLLPRFVEDLNLCEHSINNNSVILHLGTEGKPYDHRALWLEFPSEAQICPPTSEDVLRSIQRQSRQKKTGKRSSFEDEDSDVEVVAEISGASVEHITEIAPEVRFVYLTTILYLAEEVKKNRKVPPEWFVGDPFGYAEIPELYASVRKCSETQPELKKRINRMLRDAGYQPGYEGLREWEHRADEDAKRSIHRAFTGSIDGFEDILKELIAFEAKYIMALDLPERAHALPRELLKVLESAFIWCIKSYPPTDIWKRVFYEDRNRSTGKMDWFPSRDQSDYKEAYQYAASELGLTPTRRFLRTKPAHIRSVVEFNHHSKLTASICGQIMYAAEVEKHPLRRVAKQYPNLLEMIDEISEKGGQAGHAGGVEVTLETCNKLRSDCFSIVASMLELPFNNFEHNP